MVSDGIVQLPWIKSMGDIYKNWYEYRTTFYFHKHQHLIPTPTGNTNENRTILILVNTTRMDLCSPYAISNGTLFFFYHFNFSS